MVHSFRILPWQSIFFKHFREMFQSPENAVMCILARRQICHKSASMLMVGLYALTHSQYKKYGFFSPTYKQATKQFDELQKWYQLYNLHCTLTFNKSDLIITVKDTGSKLYFYSLERPDNIRGETLAGAFVDEAAFIDDNAFGIVMPMLDVEQGFLVAASTPWLRRGLFYQLCYDKKTVFEDWTKYDLSEYVSAERLAFYKRTLSPSLYKADILGEWLDDGESLLYGNISDCIVEYPYHDEPLFVGIDLATGQSDYCSISAFYKVDNLICEYETVRFQNSDVSDNVQVIYDWLSTHNIQVVNIETNGVGLPMYQLLKRYCRDAGNYDLISKLKEDFWSGATKGQSVTDSIMFFKTHVIRLHTRILVDEAQSYTEIVDKHGKISFGNAHQSDRQFHDDCWCAALHALSAITKSRVLGKYNLS